MRKQALQWTTAVLALVPTLTGLVGLAGLDDPLYAAAHLPRDATLDSNLRFYAGVWLGLGIAAWSVIPGIERQGGLFRLLWAMIFLGGLGRLLSLALVGLPFPPFVGFTALEVLGAPLFIWWEHRVAVAADAALTPARS